MAYRGGQPKKFTRKQFHDCVICYFEHIYNNQNDKETVSEPPTFFGFYRYANEITGCSYHTIRRCFDEYWADIKKEFEQMRADLLVRGSAIGRYNSTMSIFALKNWCSWRDNPVDASINADDIRQDELSKSLSELAKELESDD